MERYALGGWVLFQLRIEYGGKFWLARTMDNVFLFGPAQPVSGTESMTSIIYFEGGTAQAALPVEYTSQLPLF